MVLSLKKREVQLHYQDKSGQDDSCHRADRTLPLLRIRSFPAVNKRREHRDPGLQEIRLGLPGRSRPGYRIAPDCRRQLPFAVTKGKQKYLRIDRQNIFYESPGHKFPLGQIK